MSSSLPPMLNKWLEGLDTDNLRELLRGAASSIPQVFDWLEARRMAANDDPNELLNLVNSVLTPHRRFYDYWSANEYADKCQDVIDMISYRAEHATPELLPVIERAIALTTRAILKSDDSSGAQGELIRQLLDSHATATRTARPSLTQAEQSRLVKWIVKYRYGGQQDFFDPDIVAYAPGLSAKSVEQYRRAIAGIELGPYGSYPLSRLAVLDRDRDAILAANGGEPTNALLAARLVDDLEEAGLHDDAVAYARIGIAMDDRGWDSKLVTFIVEDAFQRDDSESAVSARRDWFARFPSSRWFALLHETAQRAGFWEREREAAEALLAERDPAGFVRYLLQQDRTDEAWHFATRAFTPTEHPDEWLSLCERRALVRPADTLPIYRIIITDTLTVTDKRNYRTAAKLLKTMRQAASAVGAEATAEFQVFLADTVDRNRRRPTCLDAFARAGLIPRR